MFMLNMDGLPLPVSIECYICIGRIHGTTVSLQLHFSLCRLIQHIYQNEADDR